jgi:drug/metabolite transporter (DMT)-like permease
MFTCALSATLVTLEQRMQAPAPRTAKAKAAANTSAHSKPWVPLLYVGVLDVGCYGLYNLGFAWCGSAVATIVLAASGQITTAVLSVLILKRQLRARHLAAVGIVTVGLVLRSMDDLLAGSLLNSNSKAGGSSSGSSSRQTQGALLVVASALLFSILGIIYERRSEGGTQRMSQAQVCAWQQWQQQQHSLLFAAGAVNQQMLLLQLVPPRSRKAG